MSFPQTTFTEAIQVSGLYPFFKPAYIETAAFLKYF